MPKPEELNIKDPYIRNMIYYLEFLEKRKRRKRKNNPLKKNLIKRTKINTLNTLES